jgi:hypothetical protein
LIGETDIKLTSKFHIKLTSKFHIKLTSKFHIKVTLKKFEFSYQNKEKYQKKKNLIRVWYVGKKIWSGNMEVFDRSLTLIPIEMHTKYISNFHIKYISNSDQFVSSGLTSHETQKPPRYLTLLYRHLGLTQKSQEPCYCFWIPQLACRFMVEEGKVSI